MWSHTFSLTSWLKSQRRLNELQIGLMTVQFDLDGALAAEQPELAWRAREHLVVDSVEVHLLNRDPAAGVSAADHAGRTCALLHSLAAADRDLAEQVWELLEFPMPDSTAEVAEEVHRTSEFLARRLHVRAAGSRSDSIVAWTDGVKLLREVARDLGIPQSDDWYLRLDGSGSPLDWYDEVMDVLAHS